MIRIGVIVGSTRPNRNAEQVATWVYDVASRRDDAAFELVDLRDYPLPHLDEPLPAARSTQYLHAHTRAWADKVASFDGFVGYGGAGGARATEHLRLICGALQMADVPQQVGLSLQTDFENSSIFKPGEYNVAALERLLDQLIAWSKALAPLRAAATAA